MAEEGYDDPERLKALAVLEQNVGKVSPTVWAFLWIGDVEKIKELAQHVIEDHAHVTSVLVSITRLKDMNLCMFTAEGSILLT